MPIIQNIANALAQGVRQAGTYSAQAAARANGVSFASQAAQGAFNQQSADLANAIGTDRTLQQYDFNSAQAASANAFTQAMWDKSAAYNSEMWDKSAAYNTEAWERSAAWNEAMMERQMQFNAAEAQKNRDWQQKMMETSYQRAVADMEKAGINPILAAGGVNGVSGGSAASVGGVSMGQSTMSPSSISPMMGQGASGGLMNGVSASEGNFSGQMEYMAGILGLISAGLSGLSTAYTAFDQAGIKEMKNAIVEAFNGEKGHLHVERQYVGKKFPNGAVHPKSSNRWDKMK